MNSTTSHPLIIQGGMGAAVSDWRLAQTVAKAGQLGVVSGTGIDSVLIRRLQIGDPGGYMKQALDHFPYKEMAQRIYDKYFVEGGKESSKPFKQAPMSIIDPKPLAEELTVVSNFVEVFLAKQGHDNPVGINYLEKIQLPTLSSIFGAMLAGVNYVLMGAGIPIAIPGILDNFSEGLAAKLKIYVADADKEDKPTECHFDPVKFCKGLVPKLKRPDFLAIVSSHTLANMLCKKASGRVDGFIIETPTAGGHNAPPRGQMELNEIGEPVYGRRDVPNLEAFEKIGRPFWLAGSYAEPEMLQQVLAQGGVGIQVGTAFAYCNESGLRQDMKTKVIEQSLAGQLDIYTDPVASPTGFPFKVVQIEETLSEKSCYESRERICDMGYLRQVYKKPDGGIGYRCASEPVEAYVRKNGTEENTVGRKCICNGLLAAINLGQTQRNGSHEAPILTAGDDVKKVSRFLKPGAKSYSAVDVINYLLCKTKKAAT